MPVPLVCPRDGSALTPTKDVLGAGTQAHVCPTCTGVLVSEWKQAQALFTQVGVTVQALHELVAKAAHSKRHPAPLACTCCGKAPMKPFVIEGAELDLCEECGACWFDRGELARLTKDRLGSTLQPAAPVAGQTSQTVGVYEMWWDCEFCGATALLGKSNLYCPQCGAQQNASQRYFPPQGRETAFNGDFDGADRSCPACNTPNGAKATHCRSCGSPLDGSQPVTRVPDRSSAAPTLQAGAGSKRAGRKLWPWVLGAIAVLGCGFCGVAMLWTKNVEVTVAAHRWSRDIDVERMQAVRDDAWCDSMPSGAYSVSRSKQQRSSKRIPDGEECSTRDVDRGNGTFERKRECHPKYREEPVYDYRCSYTIDRWQKYRTEQAHGRDTTPAPQWPAVHLVRGGCSALGCEREGSRHEAYTLELTAAEGKTYTCTVSEVRWHGAQDGLKKPIKVGVITDLPECDEL